MRLSAHAAQPFPFCLSHGLDAALNSTGEMRFSQAQLHKDTTVGCKVATPLKDAFFKLASVTDTSMNHKNHMKRLDHCLWLCRMARTTEIFLSWTGYFQRKKSGEFEGKIWLAHMERRGAIRLWGGEGTAGRGSAGRRREHGKGGDSTTRRGRRGEEGRARRGGEGVTRRGEHGEEGRARRGGKGTARKTNIRHQTCNKWYCRDITLILQFSVDAKELHFQMISYCWLSEDEMFWILARFR